VKERGGREILLGVGKEKSPPTGSGKEKKERVDYLSKKEKEGTNVCLELGRKRLLFKPGKRGKRGRGSLPVLEEKWIGEGSGKKGGRLFLKLVSQGKQKGS